MRRHLWSAVACGFALVTGFVTCLLQSANFECATRLDRTQEEIDRLQAVNAELEEQVLSARTRALEDMEEGVLEHAGDRAAGRGVVAMGGIQ